MRPLVPNTRKGRLVSRDDIHHRTTDQSRRRANASAKAAKHAARQQGRKVSQDKTEDEL